MDLSIRSYRRLLVLVGVIALGGRVVCQYIPLANEELFATWLNVNMALQKTVNLNGEIKDYMFKDDSSTYQEATEQIASKWTDSDGNIWYQTFGTMTSGPYKGIKYQDLHKLSKDATVNEFQFKAPVFSFSPNGYPKELDSSNSNYRIYYRAGS
jgi:hypothetical protein